MLILRKILFWLFSLAYLVVCPLVILYSIGFIINPDTKELEERGIIYISSLPSDAAIFINGKEHNEHSPAIIEHLRQNRYRVTINKRGYQTWEKIVPVYAQKSTSLKQVLLVPLVWPKIVSSHAFNELIPIDRTELILLQRGKLLKDLFRFAPHELPMNYFNVQDPLRSEYLHPLAAGKDVFAHAKISRIFTIPGSPFILVQAIENIKTIYLWFDLRQETMQYQDISALVRETPDQIFWAETDRNNLFLLYGSRLTRVHLSSETVYPHIVSGIKSASLFSGKIYVLSSSDELYRVDFNGENREILLNDPLVQKKLFASYENIDMTVYSDDLIVFRSGHGALMLNHLPHIFVRKGVLGTSFDFAHERLLFWTKNQLGYIDLKSGEQDKIFEEGPELHWLDVRQNHIRKAYWANDGQNVIFSTKRKVFLTERLFPQGAKYEVTDIKSRSAIFYSRIKGDLFFLDKDKDFLSAVEIVPGGVPEVIKSLLTDEGKADSLPDDEL